MRACARTHHRVNLNHALARMLAVALARLMPIHTCACTRPPTSFSRDQRPWANPKPSAFNPNPKPHTLHDAGHCRVTEAVGLLIASAKTAERRRAYVATVQAARFVRVSLQRRADAHDLHCRRQAVQALLPRLAARRCWQAYEGLVREYRVRTAAAAAAACQVQARMRRQREEALLARVLVGAATATLAIRRGLAASQWRRQRSATIILAAAVRRSRQGSMYLGRRWRDCCLLQAACRGTLARLSWSSLVRACVRACVRVSACVCGRTRALHTHCTPTNGCIH